MSKRFKRSSKRIYLISREAIWRELGMVLETLCSVLRHRKGYEELASKALRLYNLLDEGERGVGKTT